MTGLPCGVSAYAEAYARRSSVATVKEARGSRQPSLESKLDRRAACSRLLPGLRCILSFRLTSSLETAISAAKETRARHTRRRRSKRWACDGCG